MLYDLISGLLKKEVYKPDLDTASYMHCLTHLQLGVTHRRSEAKPTWTVECRQSWTNAVGHLRSRTGVTESSLSFPSGSFNRLLSFYSTQLPSYSLPTPFLTTSLCV